MSMFSSPLYQAGLVLELWAPAFGLGEALRVPNAWGASSAQLLLRAFRDCPRIDSWGITRSTSVPEARPSCSLLTPVPELQKYETR